MLSYASELKFIFFVFNVCYCMVFPDLQVQNHFFFMCMCVVVAFQVEIHFFNSSFCVCIVCCRMLPS